MTNESERGRETIFHGVSGMLCLRDREDRFYPLFFYRFIPSSLRFRITGNDGAPSAPVAGSTWKETWWPPARNTPSIRTVSTVKDVDSRCWVRGPKCPSFKVTGSPLTPRRGKKRRPRARFCCAINVSFIDRLMGPARLAYRSTRSSELPLGCIVARA